MEQDPAGKEEGRAEGKVSQEGPGKKGRQVIA
jgi:hypothetical protein